jgi:hypothetical protein
MLRDVFLLWQLIPAEAVAVEDRESVVNAVPVCWE